MPYAPYATCPEHGLAMTVVVRRGQEWVPSLSYV
jgi:hypothetical protein